MKSKDAVYTYWLRWYNLFAARCPDIPEAVRNETSEALANCWYDETKGEFPMKQYPLGHPNVINPKVHHALLTLLQRSF